MRQTFNWPKNVPDYRTTARADRLPKSGFTVPLDGRAALMLLKRFYRLRDAAGYVGMSVALFNELVRPYLTEIPIGKQGIAFDQLELDAWADHHMAANGRPARKESLIWDAENQPASTSEAQSGGSTRKCTVYDFDEALKRVTSK